MNWTVEASRVVHHDRWITVRADDCRTPAGVAVAPYYVLEYPDWVHVLAVTDDEQVVLVRQYRHGLGAPCWELPGGAVDAGETAAMAARRELREETGYAADALEPLLSTSPNPATHANRYHAFLARSATRSGPPAPDAAEELELELGLFTATELLALIDAGDFPQVAHVATALVGLRRLGWLRG